MKKIIIILFALCTGFISTAQEVTTFCGSTEGYVDGEGTVARFNGPGAMCTDVNGNLYVSDSNNHKIRKITPTGVVTTFAGSTQGYLNGTGSVAQFSLPHGICIDANGNIYVADTANHAIRKITPAGVVTTLAGSGADNIYGYGYVNGTGAAAKFDRPEGVCVDNAGNVYVTDYGNGRIRKITPAGEVTTLAGSDAGFSDGTGIAAGFSYPIGICIDINDNLYVTYITYVNGDSYVGIRKVTSAGVVTTIVGSTRGYVDGEGSTAQFKLACGICLDTSGNLYVADADNNRIRKISPAGVVTTLAGSDAGYADGTVAAAKFNSPFGICVNSDGDLFVSDKKNFKIRKITISNLGSTQNTAPDFALKVYPNPVSSVLHLQLANEMIIERIVITDVTGKIMSQQSCNFNSVNVEHLAPGAYFVQAFSGDKKRQTKFIKE